MAFVINANTMASLKSCVWENPEKIPPAIDKRQSFVEADLLHAVVGL